MVVVLCTAASATEPTSPRRETVGELKKPRVCLAHDGPGHIRVNRVRSDALGVTAILELPVVCCAGR